MHVAVVGAGLAGLVAARELLRAGAQVSLFDAAERLGGQVWTERRDGFVVERGAEGFPPPDHELRELLTELGLLDRLVPQRESLVLALASDRVTLEPLPPGAAPVLLGLNVSPSERGRGIVSFPTGTEELVERLAADFTDQLTRMAGEAVSAIGIDGSSWRIVTRKSNEYAADGLLLALPADALGELLSCVVADDALVSLRRLPLLSSVTVAVAFPRSCVSHPLDASGLVVPQTDRTASGLRAVTFASSKFAGRAPEGWVLVRAFQRPGDGRPLEAPDARWIGWAVADLEPLLGLAGAPDQAWVDRWPRALARGQGRPAGWARTLDRRLRHRAPAALAGAACHGAGVVTALRSGRAAAAQLLARLGVTSRSAAESL